MCMLVEVTVNKKVSLVLLVLLIFAATAAFVGAAPAAAAPTADTRPLAVTIGYESALNSGDTDGLAALFADGGVLIDGIGGDPVAGRAAIRDALAAQLGPNRSFDVVWANMSGNQVTLVVDIADRGVVWGRQTLRMTVEDGLIRSLEPIAFRILF